MFNDDTFFEFWEQDDRGGSAHAYEQHCIHENLFFALQWLDYKHSMDVDKDGKVSVTVHARYFVDVNLPVEISMPLSTFEALVNRKHQG